MTTPTATVTATCDDLLIGGTISGSTLSGGTSISNVGISVVDYGALWGTPGFRQTGATIIGQPGVVIPTPRLPAPRRINLALAVRPFTLLGVYSETQFDANMSTVIAALNDPDGFLLQWTRADATVVWIRAWLLSPITVGQIKQRRNMVLPLTTQWPYWQDETLNTDTVNGAGVTLSPVIGGDVPRIYNPTLVFAGAGSFTDVASGLVVTTTAAVTVARDATSGRWRITQGGTDTPGLASWNDKRVMMLTKGGTFTSTVSVDVTWRDTYG